MASARVSAHLPLYDPSKSSLAYGARALPKLNRELLSPTLPVRQQALLLLSDVLHKREHLATALREGIAGSLKGLLEDADEVVRQRAAHALGIIAQHSLGRDTFLSLELVSALSKLFSDAEYAVRFNAHTAVEMCARIREGAEGVVGAGLVPLLVEKLVEEEKPELKEVILDTLHWCFQVDTAQGLSSNTIAVATHLLTHPAPPLKARAARLISDLTVPYEGKGVACGDDSASQDGTIPRLVSLLSDEDAFVRSQAAAALMSIAVITKGKFSVLAAGATPPLTALLSDDSSEARLNGIKAATLLAEAPQGKAELQSILPQLKELASSDGDAVRKAASTAVRVITWRP